MAWHDSVPFSILEGKTLVRIDVATYNDRIVFETDDSIEYQMLHHQDCCESVGIEDIVGDLEDLLYTPILHASEDTNDEPPEGVETSTYRDDCEMWTFYNLRTIKGSVTLRWFGSSNGYYGVSVDFERMK